MQLVFLFFPLLFCVPGNERPSHPVFVTVTNLDYNEPEKRWESSSRIFTHDFETTLRKRHSGKVDLLDNSLKPAMDSLVAIYMKDHLSLAVNGSSVSLQYLGYEQDEEAVMVYLEGLSSEHPVRLQVENSLLYDFKEGQSAITHVTVKGVRKSKRNNNPVTKATFDF